MGPAEGTQQHTGTSKLSSNTHLGATHVVWHAVWCWHAVLSAHLLAPPFLSSVRAPTPPPCPLQSLLLVASRCGGLVPLVGAWLSLCMFLSPRLTCVDQLLHHVPAVHVDGDERAQRGAVLGAQVAPHQIGQVKQVLAARQKDKRVLYNNGSSAGTHQQGRVTKVPGSWLECQGKERQGVMSVPSMVRSWAPAPKHQVSRD